MLCVSRETCVAVVYLVAAERQRDPLGDREEQGGGPPRRLAEGHRTWRLKKGGAECNQGSNFTEKELVDLTLAIVARNGWNRIAIGFRAVPGAYE